MPMITMEYIQNVVMRLQDFGQQPAMIPAKITPKECG
jgi:hypothetical protein